MNALQLFERITFSIKRLVLDYDLSDKEAKQLAKSADKVNGARATYTTRKLEESDD